MPAPDISQVPVPGPNAPASGTYGEGASLDRLKAALPSVNPSGPAAPPNVPSVPAQPVQPASDVGGRPPTGAAAPPGMPAVLLAPTNHPEIPVTTPLSQPVMDPVSAAVDDQSKRRALLEFLSNSDQVSPQTREWAKLALAHMRVLR